jgi:NTE family protein
MTKIDSRPLPLTLALSGGGVKCAAQAGVLAVLDEAGLPVGGLTGISGGGLVALLYAAGMSPPAIRDYMAATSLLEVWELDPARRALFGAAKIRARIRAAVGDRTFDDLRVPVIVLAVDLKTGREVRLASGRVDDAILATMAMPGVFAPLMTDGMTLVDGGVLNPLPLDVAREMGQRVAAVDVLYHLHPLEPLHIFEDRGPMRLAADIGRRLGLAEVVDHAYQGVRLITNRVIDLMLQRYPPDVLVRPAVGKIGLFAFDLAGEAYEIGRAAALAALPQLQALAQPSAPPLWRRVFSRS